MQKIVFTFVGDDKPGLVQRISELVSDSGGNWLESRLSHMAGKFAGIVSVEVAENQAESLLEQLSGLADCGLSVVAERSQPEAPAAALHGSLTVLGNDRPGIVHEVSATLAAMNINIQDMSSDVQSAPMAGIPLFSASIAIAVADDLDAGQLEEKLDEAANHLDVDISLDLNPRP